MKKVAVFGNAGGGKSTLIDTPTAEARWILKQPTVGLLKA
jgi:ABC-type transport system involved in cytochrome bd biosynthesis fused ATPase/permease subunit